MHRASSEPPVTAGPPLDYSFKELRQCAEIETEEPRSGLKHGLAEAKETKVVDASASVAADTTLAPGNAAGTTGALGATAKPAASLMPRQKFVVRTVTTSVKLNNNMLETLQGLPRALEVAVTNPLENIHWLDLSFNQISTIEPELLQFQNLKALYLHGNCVKSLPSVERLRKLPRLLSLTLNGNPIEASKVYRMYAIGALQHLRSLDHSTITEDELRNAQAWFKGHQIRQKKRQELLEEKAMMIDE